MSQFWKITGRDGNQPFYERRIPIGSVSEAGMVRLLQHLAARHLDEDEVVESSLRKNAKGYRSHWEIRKNIGGKPGLMTMTPGHHYTATIEEGKDA